MNHRGQNLTRSDYGHSGQLLTCFRWSKLRTPAKFDQIWSLEGLTLKGVSNLTELGNENYKCQEVKRLSQYISIREEHYLVLLADETAVHRFYQN